MVHKYPKRKSIPIQIIGLLFLFFIGITVKAQCPMPVNDATMANTGSGANPATTIAPISYIGTVTAGADETRMLVYMNTINQFNIPSEITAADLPSVTNFGNVVAYNGRGQQLMANYNQASSNFFVASNLEPGTKYYFYTVKVSRCGVNYTINSEIVPGNVIERTTSAAGLSENITAKDAVFGASGVNDITLNSFTGITSPTAPTGYIIKMNTTNSFTPVSYGTDPATLSGNTVYGGGEQTIYVGNSNSPSLNITGLTADTQYYFKIYGYKTFSSFGTQHTYQTEGYTTIVSTTTAKSPATITLTGNTSTNMTVTVNDPNIILTATSNSTSGVFYQIVEAPSYTSLRGSTLALRKAGTIVLEAISPGDATYTSNKEIITITVSKAVPTFTFNPFTVSANATTNIPYTTNSDGLISYSIVGATNGNSLTGTYNNQVVSGVSGSKSLLEVTTPETDYYLASTTQAYVTALSENFFFTTETDLYSLEGATATSIVGFTTNTAATGNKPYSTAFINGQIWGTTFNGGANGKGVIYKVDKDGSNFVKVADLTSVFSSAFPFNVQEINGKVYGITYRGGSAGAGTVWSAETDGTGYSVLHTFDSSSGLYWPFGQLVEYGGKIYGSTSHDATNNRGGIFSIDYDGSNYAVEYLATTSNPNPQYGLTLWKNRLWYPSGSRVHGWDPVSKIVTNSISTISGTKYEPVVINDELYITSSQYIEKSTNGFSSSVVHTFATPNDVYQAQGYLTFDGTRLWGTAMDGTSTYPVIYSILPDGSNLKQEWKGTVKGAPSNNITRVIDIQTPTLSFANQTVEHLSISKLIAQTSSTSPITYSLIGDTTASALSNDQFTAGSAGTVTIRASVAANDKFNAATVDATFTIARTNPKAMFSNISRDFNSEVVSLAPDVTNYTGSTITYAFVNGGSTSTTGATTGSTINGNQLTIGTPGKETIRASFPANGNFNGATFDFQLTINNATADLSGFVDLAVAIGQDDQLLTVSSAPNITMNYELLTSNTGVILKGANNAVIQAGTSTGTETIRVTVIEPNYNNTTKDITVTVNPSFANISWNPPAEVPIGTILDSSLLNATTNISGSFTYFLNGFAINHGITNLWNLRSYALKATFTPDDLTNYQVTSVTNTITTKAIDLVIKLDDKSKKSTSADPAFSYTIVDGNLAQGDVLFVPMKREAGTAVGTYAITIDETQQSTQDDGESAGFICPTGLCVWGNGSFVIYQTKFGSYNITIENGTFTITDKTPITSSNVVLNAPNLVYDGTEKSYTATPDSGLSPVLPTSDVEFTYKGTGNTTYASSATAPIEVGNYLVTAIIKDSNGDYAGQFTQGFEITPVVTTINLNIPSSPLTYTGNPQGVTATANDINSNPIVPVVIEYSKSSENNYSTTAPINAGTYKVRATISNTTPNYTATTATGIYSIESATQTITFNAIPEVACGQTQIDLSRYAKSSVGSTLTFVSDNTSVATINGNIATIIGAGTANITASQSGGINAGAAVNKVQALVVSASQDNFSVDVLANVRICDSSPYVLPILTSGNYYTQPDGGGSQLSAGASITSTTTLYIYGISSVNTSCTDQSSFTINMAPVLVDNLPNVTATGSYTLPALTNGNYFTGTNGSGTALVAGNTITSTQTIYIFVDEGSGCTNETSFDVTIIPNPALHFEQVTNFTDYDYLSVPDANSLDFTNHFTFEAWINFDQLSVSNAGFGWRSIMAKSRYTDSYALMVYAPSKLMRFYHAGFGSGSTDFTWSSLTIGSWNHIAVKIDGTNNKASILINGVEVASSTDSGSGTLTPNTEPLLIGAGDNRANDPYPFDGAMDEVRFWNVARTDTEISNAKDYKLQGDETGLVAYYSFDEGTVQGNNTGLTQITDRSTQGNNASFNNFALTGNVSNYVDGSGNGVSEKSSQTITFNPLADATYGDTDFALNATSDSGLVVTYASSDTSVVTVSGNMVTVVGEGTATITASQVGNATYNPATDVQQSLTVNKRAIEVTADAGTKVEGATDPTLTYQITSGSLVSGDNFTGTLTRSSGEAIGGYSITQGTLALGSNYTITFVGNTFSITRDAIARWDGTTNSVWNAVNNWEEDIAPLITDNFIIPNVTTAPNIASGVVAQMNSLTVETSSSLRISEEGAAIIENNFDNSGTVVITSTANNSGVLLVKGSANGMVTYERGGLLANQWSIVTAPVSGQSIKEFAENPANAIRVNPTVTPNRYAIGYYDDSKLAGSKWTYYTTADLATNSLTFEQGRSYIISRATDGVVSFTGTIETGNVTKTVAASQWNAVGNPYTAYVPVNENGGVNFILDNISKFDPVNVGVYVWDNAQNKYVANSLVTRAKSLAPGQGFFFRTTTGVTDIVFKESLRSVQNIGGIFNRGIEIVPSIELQLHSNDVMVNTTIAYRSEASLGLDPGYDLGNFDATDLDVFTHLVNGEKSQNFTYQSLPTDAIANKIIAVGVKANAGKELVFSTKNNNLPKGVEVYLEDRLLHKFVKIDTEKTYKVQLQEKQDGVGRFYLHTKSQNLTTSDLSLSNIKIYNANSEVFVEGINGNNFEINVFNTIGSEIFSGTFEGIGKNRIVLPSVEVGVYIVRINTELGIKTKKIIIKK